MPVYASLLLPLLSGYSYKNVPFYLPNNLIIYSFDSLFLLGTLPLRVWP